MFKSAMGYLGGVTSSGMTTSPILDSPEDALVGSIVDVGGQKVIVRKRVGEGGFAFVYKVEDVNESSRKFALKRLLAMDEEKRKLIVKEISLMKSLSGHPSIVKFVSAAEAKGVSQRGCDEFLVLMEFCPTNLSEVMTKRNCKPYPPSTVAKIFAQVTSAVAKMHRASPPIVHRDLKLENLLVDDTGKLIKLCDFGSATTETYTPNESWSMNQRTNLEEEMAKHTTPMYRAPEMLDTWSNHSIHTGADIWALGCLLYFLCFGRHPFEDSAKLAILNGNYRIPANDISHIAFHDFIRQMLVVDPSFRPTINQVQEHLASLSVSTGLNATEGAELDLELSSLNNSNLVRGSASNESLSSASITTTSEAPAPAGGGIMSSLRGGAGSFMGKIRDTSKAVIQTVQHSMASRDLDLHLITERIAAMSYPAEGLESAMRNHIDDIAAILENRHPSHYSVMNLTDRSPYSVQKFATGLVSQPGWSTQKPTAFKTVLETLNLCLDFLRRDSSNIIVIHCIDGKSNTAVLVVGLLIACGFVQNYKDGLKFFGLKRCEAALEPHHKVMLRYLESAFSGPSSLIESRVVTLTSVVLEPVPCFSKTADGARPFIEVAKCDSVSNSPLKVAPSADYASLAFFSSYDEEAILKVNTKIDGDVMITVYHARQTNLLFANKFDKILICRLYFHTGFLGGNSSSLRFKLRDMDLGHQGQTSLDFKVVVNFRPEKDIKSMPLKCKNADLSLLFGTKDEMMNNREMMGSEGVNNGDGESKSAATSSTPPLFVALSDQPQPEQPKAPPRTKVKEKTPVINDNEDILISPVNIKAEPVVPQPATGNGNSSENVLLDFGQMVPPSTVKNTTSNQQNLHKEDLFSDKKDDLFSDFATPPPSQAATANHVTSSSNNIDCLLDISGSAGSSSHDFLNPSPSMMKTSSSAENFKATIAPSGGVSNTDPFGDLLGLKPTPILASSSNTTPKMSSSPANSKPATAADDLLSKMLNDLDVKPKMKPVNNGNGNQQQSKLSSASTRPNYNVSFNNGAKISTGSTTAPTSSTTNTNKKSFSNTFEDLLGPNFNVNNGATGSGNSGKSIGEMKKAETMKTMTAEEAQVFAWKDGKTRNIRALLCSLHTVIWPDSRWKQCGMHQLVDENGVKKMYQRACLAVHPDKQMGTPNEELSKLIFIELNDAWAEFKKDS